MGEARVSDIVPAEGLPDDDEPEKPAVDASDPEQIEERARRKRITDRDKANALKAMLNLPAGREWLADVLLGPGRLFTPVVNAAYDPHATAFHDGARSLALTIHKDALRLCPEQYMVLLREHMHKM